MRAALNKFKRLGMRATETVSQPWLSCVLALIARSRRQQGFCKILGEHTAAGNLRIESVPTDVATENWSNAG